MDAPKEVYSMMESMVKKNALKYAVGQAIFCPACQTCLDCTRAVTVDVMIGERCAKSVTVCATCFDSKVKANMETAMQDPRFHDCKLEITDGRILFAAPKRAPKAAAKKAPTKKRVLPPIEEIMAAAEEGNGTGYCTACGNEQGECEPDARRRICDACGQPKVYGAEELLLMSC